MGSPVESLVRRLLIWSLLGILEPESLVLLPRQVCLDLAEARYYPWSGCYEESRCCAQCGRKRQNPDSGQAADV